MTSSVMTSAAESEFSRQTSAWMRRGLLSLLFVALWTVIVLRLISLQGFGHGESMRLARRQHAVAEVLMARPGDIRDRAGRLLATSARTDSLAIDPAAIEEPVLVAEQLAMALQLNPHELIDRIVAADGKRFLWIKRRLSPEEADRVRSLKLPREIWHFRTEYQRLYPQGDLAAHVLGTRDIDNRGQGGVEEGLSHLLVGKNGERTLLRDSRGIVLNVDSAQTIEPQHGQTVQLTIDSLLQLEVEQRLNRLMEESRPLGACAIVIDPRTGEVLAMASRPEIPARKPTGDFVTQTSPQESFNQSVQGATDPAMEPDQNGWRNHAIASMFEPGSTFKPFMVAAAIERGVIKPDEVFDCERGAYRMGRRTLHDHHSYGLLDVTDILVKSSNIGMAKIGERLENAGMYQAAVSFGFGRPTGIELPGELSGQLHPLSKWTSYSTGSIPMGQELAATPLQMAAAHAALANHGMALSPHLLLKVEADNAEGSTSVGPTIIGRQLVSRETADWLVTGPMTEVVTRGTGKNAKIPGYTVFGKTGTAQKLEPETGRYSHTRHIGSFACGAPAHDPRAVVLIAVDEPRAGPSTYGGIVAAPAAADILLMTLKHLGVEPDRPDEIKPETKPARRGRR